MTAGSAELTCSQTSAWGNGCAAVRACDHPAGCVLSQGYRASRRASRRRSAGAARGARRGARRNAAAPVRTPGHLESNSMRDKHEVSRRGFLETAGAATGAAVAAGAFPHPAVGAVKGANEKINIAVLGPGGRARSTSASCSRHEEQRATSRSTSSASATSGTATKERRPRPVLLGQEVRPGRRGQGQGPHHQGLSQDPRLQGRRRRPDRHARPLARQDVDRRHGGRQGRLLRKADDPHDRRGPPGLRDGQEDQAGLHRGRPVDRRPALAAWPTR